MPRPKKETGAEPKKRSRTGCWPCKARKVKCGEEKPACANCVKSGETCDYSIRLNWGGRGRKDGDDGFTFVTATPSPGGGGAREITGPHEHVFSAQHIAAAPRRPPTPEPTSGNEVARLDPRLRLSRPPHLASARDRPEEPPDSSPRASPSAGRASPVSVHAGDDPTWSPVHRTKRVRREGARGARPGPAFALPLYPGPDEGFPAARSGSPPPPRPAHPPAHDPPDLRRLSVRSLLSDPAEQPERPRRLGEGVRGHRTYGYDHGFPDLDVPHNDDRRVVLPRSPDLRRPSAAVSELSASSADGDARQIAFEPGGYYAQPVPVRIPRALEPLPPELLANQMDLLYFHHFINHTGRIMVPHDCPENPFRGVLAQMAVRDPHLLHLLLVFSASHRARLLDHPAPANRIAGWMSDVLPALRRALDEPSPSAAVAAAATDPADPSSLAPLATAITLAALEIFTPDTFAVRIPWQQHLQVARRMIMARGGLDALARGADGARDKAVFFLSRWFAYLDVLGSLSNRHEQPLFGAYLEDGGGLWLVNRDNEEVYQIDCFFGFSGRCIALLAQVAELAAQCDNQRIDPVTNQVKAGWLPPDDLRARAEELRRRLEASASTVYRGCTHTSPDEARGGPLGVDGVGGDEDGVGDEEDGGGDATAAAAARDERDAAQILAINEAFHWAGLIHLSRRVLARPSSHPEVQDAVRRVLASLAQVRRGSSAESCLLFPMFTAGCEAQCEDQRAVFRERLRTVEGWGMRHVGRARALMQTVWDTCRPWETLVDGEFFG